MHGLATAYLADVRRSYVRLPIYLVKSDKVIPIGSITAVSTVLLREWV